MHPLPPQRPRRQVWHQSLLHDQRRLIGRFVLDPARAELGQAAVGQASWLQPFANIFGSPSAFIELRPTATVINFPERRSELAKLRDEAREIIQVVRGGCGW
jgi:hypothetical protein